MGENIKGTVKKALEPACAEAVAMATVYVFGLICRGIHPESPHSTPPLLKEFWESLSLCNFSPESLEVFSVFDEHKEVIFQDFIRKLVPESLDFALPDDSDGTSTSTFKFTTFIKN